MGSLVYLYLYLYIYRIVFSPVAICFIFEQAFFPLGPVSHMIYGGLSALIFSTYIVYDTDNLIKRYSYDEHIWASVALYLDIVNLFLALLEILRSVQDN